LAAHGKRKKKHAQDLQRGKNFTRALKKKRRRGCLEEKEVYCATWMVLGKEGVDHYRKREV